METIPTTDPLPWPVDDPAYDPIVTPPDGFDPFGTNPGDGVDIPIITGGYGGGQQGSGQQGGGQNGSGQNGSGQQNGGIGDVPPTGETAGALAPVAVADAYETTEGEALDVSADNGLLANDTGDQIVVEYIEQPDHGAVSLEQDGAFRYEPADGYAGVDTFDYQVLAADGQLSEPVTVSIQVEPLAAPAVAAADPGLFAGLVLGLAALATVITAGTLVLRRRTRRLAAA